MKNKSWFSMEKTIKKREKKMHYYNNRQLFPFRKFGLLSASILKNKDLEGSFNGEQIKARHQNAFFE